VKTIKPTPKINKPTDSGILPKIKLKFNVSAKFIFFALSSNFSLPPASEARRALAR